MIVTQNYINRYYLVTVEYSITSVNGFTYGGFQPLFGKVEGQLWLQQDGLADHVGNLRSVSCQPTNQNNVTF